MHCKNISVGSVSVYIVELQSVLLHENVVVFSVKIENGSQVFLSC